MDWRLIALVALVSPTVVYGLLVPLDAGPYFPRFAAATEMEDEYQRIGCDEAKSESFEPNSCSWGEGETTVLLIGDSNARQHIPGLREVRGYKFVARTRSGCPLSENLTRDGVLAVECARWTNEIRDYVSTLDPDLVLIAVARDLYTRGNTFDWVTEESDSPKSARLETEVRNFLDSINQDVEFVGQITKFTGPHGYPTLMDCSILGLELYGAGCLAVGRTILPPNDEVGIKLPAVSSLSSEPSLYFYRDGGHLNPQGSRLYRAFWESTLSEVLSTQSTGR